MVWKFWNPVLAQHISCLTSHRVFKAKETTSYLWCSTEKNSEILFFGLAFPSQQGEWDKGSHSPRNHATFSLWIHCCGWSIGLLLTACYPLPLLHPHKCQHSGSKQETVWFWMAVATLCSAVTAYAQCSEPKRDRMLSWHTLSSKWPSGEQGGGQVKCAREGQVAKWGISRNGSKKRNTQERLNTRKAERRKKNTEEKTLTVPRAIFLPKKKKKKEKRLKLECLGVLWAYAFSVGMAPPRVSGLAASARWITPQLTLK